MSDSENAPIEPVGELKRLTAALHSQSVPYALCGGLAVGVHGYIRATRDVDLLVLTSDLGAVKRIASEQGYLDSAGKIAFRDPTFQLYRMTKIIQDPYADPLVLDLLLVDDSTNEIWQSRETIEWEGKPLSVVSKEGLVAMKQAAGRDQDLLDIKELES